MLTTEDFAVVVRKLPQYEDYNSNEELKVLLWNHLEEIMSTEKHQNPQFKKSDNHSQIVNIHFGMTSFERLKVLQSIYNDMKEQMREEKRLEKLSPQSRAAE